MRDGSRSDLESIAKNKLYSREKNDDATKN